MRIEPVQEQQALQELQLQLQEPRLSAQQFVLVQISAADP
jgi:hypothetical protein